MSIFSDIYVDRVEIPQGKLNIENKQRSNPLKWRGQFSPQFVEVLLQTYSKADDIIFDPFVGSGTVLFEAAKRNNIVYGTEINPAAYILSKLYGFVNVPHRQRANMISRITLLLNDHLFPAPLFAPANFDIVSLKDGLSYLLVSANNDLELDLIKALIALLDFYKSDLNIDKIFKVWSKITELVVGLHYSDNLVKIFHCDARRVPLKDRSVDLVITSPPYINVFNYHQQYRASMEFLSWNLLEVAKSEIGSNRKHRSNRFLTVIQYCLDLAQCFAELQRVCKPGSRIIFVIGRTSTVRGIRFYNGEILSEVILRSFEANLDLRQERVFINRFGKAIVEDILHFSFGEGAQLSKQHYLFTARQVAGEVLLSALRQSSDKSSDGLKQALEKISMVDPSRLFVLEENELTKYE